MRCAEDTGEPDRRQCNPGECSPLDDAAPAPPPIGTTSPSLASFVLYAERSIRNPPFSAATSVCEINLVGTATLQDGHTGLVRLSETSGGSGVGTSSPIYLAGQGSPGCS